MNASMRRRDSLSCLSTVWHITAMNQSPTPKTEIKRRQREGGEDTPPSEKGGIRRKKQKRHAGSRQKTTGGRKKFLRAFGELQGVFANHEDEKGPTAPWIVCKVGGDEPQREMMRDWKRNKRKS